MAAKDSKTTKAGKAAAKRTAKTVAKATGRAKIGPKPENEVARLIARVSRLEDTVEALVHAQFYRHEAQLETLDLGETLAATDRYIKATSDGWLYVTLDATRTPLPCGVKVSLNDTSGGRDFGTVREGVHTGKNFDVTAGNLAAAYRRLDNLMLTVRKRPGGPVHVDGQDYDLELRMRYDDGGVANSAGPFPSMTYSGDPLPNGDHDVAIADYPHDKGLGYGQFATVWFRIGQSGARYVHPGRISAGCLTCAPSRWPEIYAILNSARVDSRIACRMNVQT